MGKLDANRVKLEENEDREKMVDDDCGWEAGRGGEQRLLPVAHLEEDGVQVEQGGRALLGGEDEHDEREEKKSGLGLVDQGHVEDDQVQVVADHHQLLQPGDHEGVKVDGATMQEHRRDFGKDGGEKEEQGDDGLWQPDAPQKENVPEFCFFQVQIAGQQVVKCRRECDKLQD